MSFFDDKRNIGTILLVCSALLVVGAVVMMISQIFGDGEISYPLVVTGLGSLVIGFLFFIIGKRLD